MDRRVNYAAFQGNEGLEWSGWVRWEDIPSSAVAKGFVTYRKTWLFSNWRVNGLAGIEVAERLKLNPLVLQAVADEKFRPAKWS